MGMYEAKQQNKDKISHVISRQPKVALKSINDCRQNNLLQLMKLKEIPLDDILLYIPLLWDDSKIDRFYEHYAEEEISNLEQISMLVKRFEESGVIQEGLKDSGKTVPKYDGSVIPKIIHRFWSGGPMNDDVLTRLISEKKENPDIRMILWYSKDLEDKMIMKRKNEVTIRNEQRKQLKNAGFEVKKIEELVGLKLFSKNIVPEREWDLFTTEAAKDTKNIAYLSDIARLMYLYKYGGHHMDVDIGMGKMFKFHKQEYRHGSKEHDDIPLLGGLLRDQYTELPDARTPVYKALEVVQNNFGSIFSKNRIESDYFKLLLQQAEASAATNSLIATHPNNELIKKALIYLLKKMQQGLCTGMAAANVYLSDCARTDVFSYIIPEYLFELQHYTEESDRTYDSR